MYPSRKDYKISVENELFATDVNGGLTFSPVYNDQQEMVIASGGVATVFKVSDPAGRPKALKLFTDEIGERFGRFERLSLFLEEEAHSFLAGFTFCRKLIFVETDGAPPEDSLYPGLIMDWIDAPTLEDKLPVLLAAGDDKALSALVANFRQTALQLLSAGVGHGDLKPSNILVTDELHLFLIDYDGMYIAPFKNLPSFELGTPSYQHPARKITDFNEEIDHFSILLIYTSLTALAARPDLIRFSDGDSLVIRQEDLLDPDGSEIFRILSQLPETRHLAYFLKRSLRTSQISIGNLGNILNGKYPEPALSLKHQPRSPAAGDEVTVSWTCTQADFLTIGGQPQPLSGSRTLTYNGDLVLDFEWGTELGSKQRRFELLFDPGPVIHQFKCDQGKVKPGTAVTLSWKAGHFEKLELREGHVTTEVTRLHSFTVCPMTDLTCTLTAYGFNDHPPVTQELPVQVYQPVLVSSFLTADNFLVESMSTYLSWEAFNAEELSISASTGEHYRLKGEEKLLVTPARTVTYTLAARNPFYSDTRQCTVVVDPLPRLQLALPKIVPDKTPLLPAADLKGFLEEVAADTQGLQDALFAEPRKKVNLLDQLYALTGWKK